MTFVLTVNTEEDPHHYVEDTAAATEHGPGGSQYGPRLVLGGVYDASGSRASSEEKAKALLNIPNEHRIISMLPLGVAAMPFQKHRRPSSEFAYREMFGKKP